jgi:hypothetical protein
MRPAQGGPKDRAALARARSSCCLDASEQTTEDATHQETDEYYM